MKEKDLMDKIKFEAGQVTEGIILGTGKVVTAIENAAVEITEDILDTVKANNENLADSIEKLEEKIEKNRISNKD